VVVEQPERDLLQALRGCRDLGEDVDAVLVLLDHPGDPTDLTLDAAKASEQVVLVHVVPRHGCTIPP
jgi:hypothetical protein